MTYSINKTITNDLKVSMLQPWIILFNKVLICRGLV